MSTNLVTKQLKPKAWVKGIHTYPNGDSNTLVNDLKQSSSLEPPGQGQLNLCILGSRGFRSIQKEGREIYQGEIIAT